MGATPTVPTYTVNFTNASASPGSVCLYQQPDALDSNSEGGPWEVLAWLVQPCNPGVNAQLQWAPVYDFFWSSTLPPETSSQALAAIPGYQVTFSCIGGAFTFATPTLTTPAAATLTIAADGSIPEEPGVSLGFGMDGAAIFGVPAEPNITLVLTPSPSPAYVLAFGTYQAGQPVSPVTETTAPLSIQFPGSAVTAYVTLDASNTLTAFYL
jgi:hypothetical protein